MKTAILSHIIEDMYKLFYNMSEYPIVLYLNSFENALIYMKANGWDYDSTDENGRDHYFVESKVDWRDEFNNR